jgi:serine O-acetyltransferase
MILHKLAEIFAELTSDRPLKIGRRFSIEHHGCIEIHGATVIGDDCMIRHGVTLGNTGFGDPPGAPTIGNGVQFGAGSKIVGRITVGNNVIIGPNAVVIRDVPDNVTVFGIAARIFSTSTPGVAVDKPD